MQRVEVNIAILCKTQASKQFSTHGSKPPIKQRQSKAIEVITLSWQRKRCKPSGIIFQSPRPSHMKNTILRWLPTGKKQMVTNMERVHTSQKTYFTNPTAER